MCGPGAEVPWPAYPERLDFELEFGCYRLEIRALHRSCFALGNAVEIEVEGIGILRNQVVNSGSGA